MDDPAFNIVAKGILENTCFQARCTSILGRCVTQADLRLWVRDRDEIPTQLLSFVRPLLPVDNTELAQHFGVVPAAMVIWNMCAEAEKNRS
ncbi:MAG: hypothetical protein WAX89_01040 [Alphaproteobacteria bacterium]